MSNKERLLEEINQLLLAKPIIYCAMLLLLKSYPLLPARNSSDALVISVTHLTYN